MKPIKNRYKIMAGIIALVAISVVILFSINLAKAKHVYEENIIFENVNYFDADAESSNLFYAYIIENDVIIETRTFGDKILETKTITSNNPTDLSLLIHNNLPFITWKTNSHIVVWDGEKQIIVTDEGMNPKLFGFGEEVYVVWQEPGGFFTKPIYTDAKWQISTTVSDYSIYNYQNEKIYISYTKSGTIHFRTFTGGWSGEKIVYEGENPHAITNGELTYIYHRADSVLNCYYGANDDIKLVEQISTTSVQEILTYRDILAFTTANGLFIQRITNEGFSQTHQITSNPATRINCFYADEDDLMFTYFIEGRVIYKFITAPEITEESTKPLVLDIGGTEELIKKNWFDYIGDYNSRNVVVKGTMKSWLMRHSGESLLFLGLLIVAFVVTFTVVMGKRRDLKHGGR